MFGEDGLFPDNSGRYQSASEMENLTLPEGLQSESIQPMYPIPPIANRVALETEFEVPRPTPLTAGSQMDQVRIQRLGDASWALVAVAPGQLWPQVRAFLSQSGMGLAATNAEAGMIDTQWLELLDSPLPSRFRFRVDSGIQRNTAELHVLQQTKGAKLEPWPAQSDDLELERDMLRNVAQFIANNADAAPVSMIADRSIGDSGRIVIEDGDVDTRLRLSLPFDRSWASTGKALDVSGFKIDDRNRSEGIYYVTFIGPQSEDDSGFFDWLWGGEEEHPLKGTKLRVLVESIEEELVYIRVVSEDGSALERRDQQGLLTLLKGNIS
ncbi:conserved hypothetical protein [Luminiphilus syltensis NOR5-1B]|uniref:Outer membrane protein assembly factor BamC n=1 Tax=Luminiphilus syltensis NOR5-1B TaxID=565045 RepID=B8KQB4_9GAMM|nr:conserved hypothetical protein [Luminiphilus syltensis NOR5-1B]